LPSITLGRPSPLFPPYFNCGPSVFMTSTPHFFPLRFPKIVLLRFLCQQSPEFPLSLLTCDKLASARVFSLAGRTLRFSFQRENVVGLFCPFFLVPGTASDFAHPFPECNASYASSSFFHWANPFFMISLVQVMRKRMCCCHTFSQPVTGDHTGSPFPFDSSEDRLAFRTLGMLIWARLLRPFHGRRLLFPRPPSPFSTLFWLKFFFPSPFSSPQFLF